jgi:superfamily II DNA or RNA helicase
MSIFKPHPDFIWSANADGLAVRLDSPDLWQKAKERKASQQAQQGYRRMQMLTECGEAEVREVDCGIFIATEDAVSIDEDTRDLFQLPTFWSGGMRLTTESVPNSPKFIARLGLVDPLSGVLWNWKLRGPILEVAGNSYLPSAAQFAALAAFKEWQSFTSKDEITNLSLLASLREAHEDGCLIHLEAYRDEGVNIARADELTINAKEDPSTGDLILCPLPMGNFPTVSVEDIEQRLTQLNGAEPRKVIRVGKKIILLDDEQSALAVAIKNRPRVPRAELKKYEQDPAGWLAENVFPDVEFEFSPRVTGIGEWQGGYMGAANGDSEDWFGAKPEPEKPDSDDKAERDEEEETKELPEAKPIVLHPLIIPNDTELGYGWNFDEAGHPSDSPFTPDFSRYQRKPMPHQEEGIRWLLGHAKRALVHKEIIQDQKAWGAGALLADDMGLGKSFTTLIALAEWIRHWRDTTRAEPPAILFVVPLSLMENWCAEIEVTFGSPTGPFNRIVMAQTDFELQNFRRHPKAKDIAEPGRVTEFGLCFGDETERSLDLPGSCVITTYQTLRDFRFSFAAANWGAAIFDEAQHIKNPNAQQTIAAKALRALLRITLTGTPVENHLGDFWCILDTAEPGPLGSFSDFRKSWIAPMNQDRTKMHEIGKELRDHVGGLMLRRTKEEELKGLLPKKEIVPISCPMTIEQELLYGEARNAVNAEASIDVAPTKGRHLAALWHLRQISLHPDLVGGGSIPTAKTAQECRRILRRSGKLAWVLDKLDEIRAKGEKVLIFCVLKDLQRALSVHLETIYDTTIPIINGDTKASSQRYPSQTRLGLINEFADCPGFGICVLSPIAAGAGLNIVAANHVIHLERHWNPAKEDQATDRAYRIGQTKPVTVYLPAASHGEFTSFDAILNNLLNKKRAFQSSLGLIPPDSVSGPDLITEIFGEVPSGNAKPSPSLTLEAALNLSWQMFEALIALLYEPDSERVILTPQSADHGADVVVLGWGPKKENILIQCKFTSRKVLDSEEGVRAVCSSAPFFETPLDVKFHRKILHTTAPRFGRRSKTSAQTCSVDLLGMKWLKTTLLKQKPTLGQVLIREACRERIG